MVGIEEMGIRKEWKKGEKWVGKGSERMRGNEGGRERERDAER